MKVQTKIALLLLLVFATFLAGLGAYRTFERDKFRRIAEQRFTERNRSFEDFLEYNGEPLKTLAEYFTSWDQMVNAVASVDFDWLHGNVNQATLDSYHANAIWIYKPDATLLYPINNLNVPDLRELPLPREAFGKLFAETRFAHFFIQLPQGLMEIRGATIHPSRDFKRDTPQNGFFFAGRLWSNEARREMSLFTNNEITLAPANVRTPEFVNDEQSGSIVFSRPLLSWDGKPIARLLIRNESRVVKELTRSSESLLWSFFVFAIVLFLVLSISLVLWVSRPLRRIMESLKRNDPRPIEALCADRSEFGELARTTRAFFEQRDNLIREMEERRVAEEALRKREEELRHSQKLEAVGRLAGGIAHDFNNLLTAIIGYAELMISRNGADPLVRQNAELIRKAGEQAATLTKQLLAFSRKQLLQPRVIDLNKLVVEMEQLLRRVIGERFDLETVPAAEIGRVRADRSQIEQVILNLGVNARDAMPRGGKLIIRTENARLDEVAGHKIAGSLPSGDYVVLSVTDTGEGMTDETKERIFEPFFTTKGPGKGTGLGLATVYGIVRQSGGGIAVESERGKGSTFRIFLPVETAPEEQQKIAAEPARDDNHSETILVVEDEQIVRELVCEVLEEHGYRVLCAANGAAALEIARHCDGEIDLLVTDVIMPQMNGQELAVKLTEARRHLKVLYISGYSDRDIGHHGELDPDIDLLQKPFTPDTLARKVRQVLNDGARVPTGAT